jgi:hypothetical protein
MSRKRIREHSTSPKFHRVAWAEKRTRRGNVSTPQVITQSLPGTPVNPKRFTALQNVKYSQDKTPTAGKGIEVAMSLPPIPAPEILAPKKKTKGKV